MLYVTELHWTTVDSIVYGIDYILSEITLDWIVYATQ